MIFCRLIYTYFYIPNLLNQPPHTTEMIQRTLLSSPKALSTSVYPVLTSRCIRNVQSISATLLAPACERITSRWYSATSEAAKSDSEAKSDNEAAVEDPKDKELAAKTKEVLELKVCMAAAPLDNPLLFYAAPSDCS